MSNRDRKQLFGVFYQILLLAPLLTDAAYRLLNIFLGAEGGEPEVSLTGRPETAAGVPATWHSFKCLSKNSQLPMPSGVFNQI